MGLLLRSIIDGSGEGTALAEPPSTRAQEMGFAPKIEVDVNAVFQLPTQTPTSIPILRPTPLTSGPTINDCGTVEPGQVCKLPLPPQPTATPYPSCLQMENLIPGD